MKKLLMLTGTLTVALLMTGYSHPVMAADNTLRPILGFKSSAINVGVDYERSRGHDMGVGGYFFYGSERSTTGFTANQIATIGAMASIHLLDNGTVDAYLAPGFGIAMIKGLGSADDETTLGPSYKLGAEWKCSPTLKVGAQYFELYNWFTDKAVASAQYASATLAIMF